MTLQPWYQTLMDYLWGWADILLVVGIDIIGTLAILMLIVVIIVAIPTVVAELADLLARTIGIKK